MGKYEDGTKWTTYTQMLWETVESFRAVADYGKIHAVAGA